VRAGIPVGAVASRDARSAEALADAVGASVSSDIGADAEMVFLTVPDHAIAACCEGIRWRPESVAVHTSGAHGLEVLPTAPRAASFHPMQSFPDPSLTHDLARGITISIEACDEMIGPLTELAERVGARALRLPSGTRPLYHASGYFASPLLVTMLDQAAAIWRSMGLNEKTALATLLPLLKETVRMVEDHGLERSLTGLVVRRDAGTLAAHMEQLRRAAPEAARHYAYLTGVSIDMALRTGRITAQEADALRAEIC
jgi:predicted short-subunit dehydrogenase-like oxidoreductase (DUF2520 family)